MVSLKLCLLDTIHAVYIKALAMVPTSRCPRFLRALLAAGHCYGPMDPVSNIIVNSAWYDMAAFPPAQGTEGELPEGVLNTGPMSRVESRSLDGLVAMLQHCNLSEHQALNYLNSLDCDLSAASQSVFGTDASSRVRLSNIPAATVAKAAKHPQHVAFGSFLASLTTEKLEHLRYLLTTDEGISDAHWTQLIAILRSTPVQAQEEMEASSCCCLSQMALLLTMPTKKSAFLDKLNIVRSRLIEVLRGYCNQHPWEPNYHLDIVCGVWQSKNSHYYHANFLASTDTDPANDAITSSSQRTLFFAEFWVCWGGESKPSSCCPIYDYRACNGHCFLCENEANKIIHPPSECHYGHINGSIDLYSVAVHKVLEVGFEGLQDSDFIYVDPDRDVELVEIINDFRDYRYYYDDDYKLPRDWTQQLLKPYLCIRGTGADKGATRCGGIAGPTRCIENPRKRSHEADYIHAIFINYGYYLGVF
ncbi:unnamed protein product [Urochloa humidicola]